MQKRVLGHLGNLRMAEYAVAMACIHPLVQMLPARIGTLSLWQSGQATLNVLSSAGGQTIREMEGHVLDQPFPVPVGQVATSGPFGPNACRELLVVWTGITMALVAHATLPLSPIRRLAFQFSGSPIS